MMKRKMIQTMAVCSLVAACAALCSCATTEIGPAPGTRAFYEKNIEGRYAVQNGVLVSLTNTVFNFLGAPGVPRAVTPTTWLEGDVSQVVNPTTIVVMVKQPLASGATRSTPKIVWLGRSREIATNEHVKLRVNYNTYNVNCVTSTGKTNWYVTAYRELVPATFEEYKAVYELESTRPEFGNIVAILTNQPLPSAPASPLPLRRMIDTVAPAPMPVSGAPGVVPAPAVPARAMPVLPPGVVPASAPAP